MPDYDWRQMKSRLDVAVVTHVPHEGPGEIGPYLSAHGNRVIECPAYLLVVMGGPMSVNDGERLPWLGREIEGIQQHLNRGTPVLGICLGAQLIAAALGAAVVPNRHREIGWWPVDLLPPRDLADPWAGVFSGTPARASVFHWHGDTFVLPPSAVLRASSPACRNQAFTVGDRVIGLQFHLEMTAEGVGALARVSADVPGGETYANIPAGVDAATFLVNNARLHTGRTRLLLFGILDYLEQIGRAALLNE